MILLSARELARQYDVDPVFENVTFDVRPGERIGLVGPNGAGKTTLLSILGGIDEPDRGLVERHSSASVALLEQRLEFDDERTLREEVQSGLDALYQLQHQAAELANQMSAASDSELARLQRRYDDIQHQLESEDAYVLEHRVDEVLHGLGFQPQEYQKPLRQLSGGQQNRAALAKMLLQAPDVMLLDEPTNHLDIVATEWLESFLTKSSQALILVSHDRYFLDRVTTRILELHTGHIADYAGNFSAYWLQREERNKVLAKTAEKQQAFVEKTEDFIRRNKYGQKHAQAADRMKKLERLESIDVPQDVPQSKMWFGDPSRTGDWVFDAQHLKKGFDHTLFADVTLRIERGDRVGILGPNGSGKTTLLRTLIGDIPPDSGDVRIGTGVNVGYYDQQLRSVSPDADALDAARPPGRPDVTPAMVRSLLARFGVRGDMVFQKVGNMSGGERSKVALARLAALNANVLILDEPTNHLDLWARDSLESALKAFSGTVLFVSHDRYFLDRCATTVIVIEGGVLKTYDGNYSDFVEFAKHQQEELRDTADNSATRPQKSIANAAPTDGQSPAKRKRRFAYRKVEDLECEIQEKEELLEQLQADLGSPDVHRDGERVKTTMRLFEQTQQDLEQLYMHWEEAAEMN